MTKCLHFAEQLAVLYITNGSKNRVINRPNFTSGKVDMMSQSILRRLDVITVHLEAGVDEKYLDRLYTVQVCCKNVTGANFHSTRFVGWTDSVGRIVTWLVCRCTDHQGTFVPFEWRRSEGLFSVYSSFDDEVL